MEESDCLHAVYGALERLPGVLLNKSNIHTNAKKEACRILSMRVRMSERISKCVPLRCCSDGLMFRLYSPFLAPVFLPQWVEDKIGGAFACYAFTARVEGALRRSQRRRMERRGRMHGRVSAVAVWTELYCPGNLSVASPRSLFLPLPPPNTVLLPQTQKHVNTHTLSASYRFTQSFQTPSHSLTVSFRSCPTWCLSWYPPFLYFPLFSPKPTWPVPPPPRPQLLIISPHLYDYHARQTVKAETVFSFPPHVILSSAQCFWNVYVDW